MNSNSSSQVLAHAQPSALIVLFCGKQPLRRLISLIHVVLWANVSWCSFDFPSRLAIFKSFFFSLLSAYLANLCRFNSSKLTPQSLPLIVQTEDLLFQPWHLNNFAGHYIVFWLVHLTESSVKMCHRYTGKTLDIIYLAHFLNVLCTWSDANKWRKELQRWRVM